MSYIDTGKNLDCCDKKPEIWGKNPEIWYQILILTIKSWKGGEILKGDNPYLGPEGAYELMTVIIIFRGQGVQVVPEYK